MGVGKHAAGLKFAVDTTCYAAWISASLIELPCKDRRRRQWRCIGISLRRALRFLMRLRLRTEQTAATTDVRAAHSHRRMCCVHGKPRKMGAHFDDVGTVQPAFARALARCCAIRRHLIFGNRGVRMCAFMCKDELAHSWRIALQKDLVQDNELQARNVIPGRGGVLKLGLDLIRAGALAQIISRCGAACSKCASSEGKRCLGQHVQGTTSLRLKFSTPLLSAGSPLNFS